MPDLSNVDISNLPMYDHEKEQRDSSEARAQEAGRPTAASEFRSKRRGQYEASLTFGQKLKEDALSRMNSSFSLQEKLSSQGELMDIEAGLRELQRGIESDTFTSRMPEDGAPRTSAERGIAQMLKKFESMEREKNQRDFQDSKEQFRVSPFNAAKASWKVFMETKVMGNDWTKRQRDEYQQKWLSTVNAEFSAGIFRGELRSHQKEIHEKFLALEERSIINS